MSDKPILTCPNCGAKLVACSADPEIQKHLHEWPDHLRTVEESVEWHVDVKLDATGEHLNSKSAHRYVVARALECVCHGLLSPFGPGASLARRIGRDVEPGDLWLEPAP